jgi:hypothetical protein
MAQQVVPCSVFPITKIFAIKNYKLDDTFLHLSFGSQSLLRTTSDLTGCDINQMTEEATRGGGVNGSLIKFFHKNLADSKPQAKTPERK